MIHSDNHLPNCSPANWGRDELHQLAKQSANQLRERCPALQVTSESLSSNSSPERVGIVLGTGLHGVADQVDNEEICPYIDLAGYSQVTADGHKGQFVVGDWNGFPICAMNGRFHLYEGYSVSQVTLPIRTMYELGIRRLVLSNASGGLNRHFRAGDVMLIDEQIDLTMRSGGELDSTSRLGSVYSRGWQHRFETTAEAAGLRVARGTYVGLTGPTYETRAEYRMLRDHIGDAVGMSTVWEAKVARSLGMEVFGISVITNVASTDVSVSTTSEEVISVAGKSEKQVEQWLKFILETANA